MGARAIQPAAAPATILAAILAVILALAPAPAQAETVVAARTLPARTVLGARDLALAPGDTAGAFAAIAPAVGMEARVSIYQGRPVMQADLRPPAIVERNAHVTMVYQVGALGISTEGRAMERAGLGEMVRVMNLSSRKIVVGRVTGPAMIKVSP